MIKDTWQFVTDAAGNRIGVIVSLEEFALIEDTLKQRIQAHGDEAKLKRIEQAANDRLFLADSRETMDAFAHSDAEWWELMP